MRLIDADRLKGILEYGILCNVPADAINTKEEKWNDWVQEVVDKAPTVKAVSIEQLEEMYTKYRKYLWRESDNVRGDDMIEIGYAEQFLQDLLAEFGCWDRESEE